MQDCILHGDALARLREMPAESVQCIVTSPPYFGLRDYQTAKWVGGSPECDHKAPDEAGATTKPSPGQREHAGRFAGSVCWRCGATRQDAQIGLEETPEQYVAKLVEVFSEARRVLRKDGVLWLNLGDSYATDTKGSGGHNPKQDSNKGSCPATLRPKNGIGSKQLLGMPWRVAFALQSDGWILRSDVIWAKPNCMPESVKDRPTKSHEYMFLFSKQERYYYDADAIKEGAISGHDLGLLRGRTFADGNHVAWHADSIRKRQDAGVDSRFAGSGYRNKRTVWTIATAPYKEAHFATFPPALVEPCILAGSRAGDVVLDPFMGAGTVGMVAKQHGRSYLGIELNASYIALAEARITEAIKPRAKITRLPKRPQRAEQLSLFA